MFNHINTFFFPQMGYYAKSGSSMSSGMDVGGVPKMGVLGHHFLGTGARLRYSMGYNLDPFYKLLRYREACVDSLVSTYVGLCQHQSAYRKGHSTETALLEVLDMAANDKQVILIVLIGLDLSAAFDTVNHGSPLNLHIVYHL